jgi:hypothetical protein
MMDMEYSGLITKYKVNRPLTEEERAEQLKQNKRLDVEPHYNLSAIRINSTYLEVVDKYYPWRGGLLLFGLVGIAIFGGLYVALVLLAVSRSGEQGHNDLLGLGGMAVICWPVIGFSIWLGLRESFTYTHYPIRLNRKNRMVYVFRRDGTVLSAPWEDLFFTFGRGGYNMGSYNWDIRGHVLDADGVTVKETFAFPMCDTLKNELLHYWEFVRRYMEDGPAKLIGSEEGQVEICHPIAGRKEGFKWGVMILYSHFAIAPLMFWILSPILTLEGLARYLANLTCDVPEWPESVEEACPIEPNDPYQRDARNNPPNLRRLA